MEYGRIIKRIAEEEGVNESVIRKIADTYYSDIKKTMKDPNNKEDVIYMRFLGKIKRIKK